MACRPEKQGLGRMTKRSMVTKYRVRILYRVEYVFCTDNLEQCALYSVRT